MSLLSKEEYMRLKKTLKMRGYFFKEALEVMLVGLGGCQTILINQVEIVMRRQKFKILVMEYISSVNKIFSSIICNSSCHIVFLLSVHSIKNSNTSSKCSFK
jgi:hypothetical protein